MTSYQPPHVSGRYFQFKHLDYAAQLDLEQATLLWLIFNLPMDHIDRDMAFLHLNPSQPATVIRQMA